MTRAPLCLAAGSLLDTDPFTCVDAAAAAGFDGIGLRLSHDHALDAAGVRRLARQVRDLGVFVHDVEVYRIDDRSSSVDDANRLIDTAADVGARQVLVVSDLADDSEGRDRTVQHLSRLVERARTVGVSIGVEYMAWTTPRGSAHAAQMAATTGAVVVLDVLHHLRVGEGPAELRALVASGRLGWVQICDAPLVPPADLLHEARHHRLVPGSGELPLAELLAELEMHAPRLVRSVEVQSDELAARLGPYERAATLYAAARIAGHPNSTG